MRKGIIFSCMVGSAMLILNQFDFFESLLMFFLAGIIPGTHHSISPSSMFYSIVICISCVIVWLSRGAIFDFSNEIITKVTPVEKSKKRLPRRRFSQI